MHISSRHRPTGDGGYVSLDVVLHMIPDVPFPGNSKDDLNCCMSHNACNAGRACAHACACVCVCVCVCVYLGMGHNR